MKTFDYRGFDASGGSRKGIVEALDIKDAREKLARGGVLADRIVPVGTGGPRPGLFGSKSFRSETRALVYRELGALLNAGLPIVKALENLIESPEMGDTRNLLAAIRDDIREGKSLSDAMDRGGKSVSQFERALIAVGERSGTLGEVIDRLATFLEEQQSVQDRVKTAMIYPAVVLTVALVVATFVFAVILPQTSRFLAEMRLPVPPVTRFMLSVGRYFVILIVPAIVLAAILVVYLRHRMARDPASRRNADRRIFSLPLVGRGYMILVNLRFARTLSLLLHGGVSVVEGFVMAGRSTGSVWIEHLAETASESVRHGGTLADAVRTIPPLSSALPGWIQAGEAGGNLESLLLNAGERYQRQWTRFVSRTLGLLEPAIILVLGAFVLLVALAILLPILSANQALQ